MKTAQPSISRFFRPTSSKDNVKSKPLIPETRGKLKGFSHVDVREHEFKELEVEPDTESATEPPHKRAKTIELSELPGDMPRENQAMSKDLLTRKPMQEETTQSVSPPKKDKMKRQTKKSELASGSVTKPKKLTPLEKQYLELKSSNHDKLLAVQVGYKFKFFGEDAQIAAKILNIMLIPGNIKFSDLQNGNFAYCSIPDNRLHIHLQRLLNHGYKVGVVKQTETASIKSNEGSKNGLFERKITGIYTKATYMGDEINTGDPTMQSRSHQEDNTLGDYIMCVDELDSKIIGIVAVQPLTGDLIYDSFHDDISRNNLETRFACLLPEEILVINEDEEISKETLKCIKIIKPDASIIHKQLKPVTQISNELTRFFKNLELPNMSQYYQVNSPVHIQSCVNELIQYLEQFQLANVFTITSNFHNFSKSGKYMLLPSQTLQALEIFQNSTDPSSEKGTLSWLLNHTRTKMGQRLLRKWIRQPLVDPEAINARLDAIDDVTSEFNHIIDALRNQLSKLKKSNVDLEKALIKIHYASNYSLERISRKELYLMLKCFQDVLRLVKSFGETAIRQLNSSLKSSLLKSMFSELLELSKSKQVDDFLDMINTSGALNTNNLNEQKIQFFELQDNPLCDEIVYELKEIDTIEENLQNELESIRKFLKRPNLNYITNLKETYLIEVRNGKAVDALPKDWLKISGTKSVLRFRSPEVSQLQKQLQYHQELLIKNCDQAYNNFLKLVDENYEMFHSIVHQLSVFDCVLSLTAASLVKSNYARPEIALLQIIDIKNSRNPIIENLSYGYSNYVANNIDISYCKNRILIITGPNMGGKSSYVKQIALLVIMCQIGCYIPCDLASVGIFDSIYVRMGASDNILKGKSTFMVEMLESANIISNFTSKSLIILDEIGRGTGTNDGIALAYSILKYLIEDDKKPLTLFITHYPSLHILEHDFPHIVSNYHMGFIEKNSESEWPEIIFLYTLVKGVIGNLYGLNVAKLAGIPDEIIAKAFEVSEFIKHDIEAEDMTFSTKLGNIIKKVKDDMLQQDRERLFMDLQLLNESI